MLTFSFPKYEPQKKYDYDVPMSIFYLNFSRYIYDIKVYL